jgi:hypothetical protein
VAAIVIFTAVVAAILLGMAASRLARRRNPDDPDPVVPEALGHAISLAVLFLAFVLVENSQAFSRARAAANAEADTVDHMFEVAGYGPQPFRQQIQGALVCYARAIRTYEWTEAERGEFAPEVSVWSNGLREPLGGLVKTNETLFEMLTDADKERATQHQNRVLEAGGTTPRPVYGLMLIILMVAVTGFAASLPRTNAHLHMAALAVLSVLLSGTLLLIIDLERPFSGLTKIEPDAISLISRELESEYGETFAGSSLPCDRTGRDKSPSSS